MSSESEQRAEIRDRMARVVFDYLRPVSNGVIIVFVVFIVFNLLELPASAKVPIVLHDFGVVLVAAVISLLTQKGNAAAIISFNLNRKISPSRWGHPFTMLLSFAVLSNILHTFALVPRGISAVHLIIFFFGASMVFLSRRWVTVVLVTGVVGWSVLGYGTLPKAEFVHYTVSVVATSIIGVMVVHGRIAINRKMIKLHLEDEVSKRQLSQLLEAKEKEIGERKKAEKLQAQLEGQLRRAQKMEAVGRLAGGVAHDINNMLAVITGTAHAVLQELDGDTRHAEDVASMLDACQRGKELTLNLLGFAMKGKYRRERIDLNKLVTSVHTFMGRTIPENIRFDLELQDGAKQVEGDAGQLNQVMVNLVNNAVDAMGEAGHLVIKTENCTAVEVHGVTGLEQAKGEYVKIVVSDTGAGMKPDTIEKAFEPFFTTKKAGETGLGLSMVYGTIANHGGTVLIRSAMGQGTAVTIYLPEYARDSLQLAKDVGVYEEPAKGGETVLLVDDEPLVRRSGSRVLAQMGYNVLCADRGDQALSMYQKHRRDITLVLLDLIMPGMDGEETFTKLMEMDPTVKVLFVSAYSKDTVRVDNLLDQGAVDFVQKPFSVEEITRAINYALAG